MAIKDFEASKIKTATITPEDTIITADGDLHVTGDLTVDGSGGGGDGSVTSGSFNVPSAANFVTTASLSIAGEDGVTAAVGDIGTDVYFYVSGSKSSVVQRSTETGKIAVFGGDLVVSGTLYAERQVVEVDENVDGDFLVSGSAVISKYLEIKDAQTVGGFQAAIKLSDDGMGAIVWDEADAAIYEDTGKLVLSASDDIELRPAATGKIAVYSPNNGTSTYFQIYRRSGGIPYTQMAIDPYSATFNPSKLSAFDFRVGASGLEGAILVDSGEGQVILGADASNAATAQGNSIALGSDVSIYLSGTIDSRDGSSPGTIVAAGDVLISGSLSLGADAGIWEDGRQLFLSGAKSISLGTGPTDSLYGHIFITGSNDQGDGKVYINPSSQNVDFIALTDDGASLRVDAGANTVLARSSDGGTGDIFKVQRWSTYTYDLLNVATSETVINDAGIPSHDFRVETDSKQYAIFTDGGTNQVLILSGGASGSPNEAAATDVAFYVSGAKGSRNELGRLKGTALFGGDVVMSGALYVHGAETDAQGVSAAAITLNNSGGSKIVWDSPGNDDPAECDAQIYETGGGLYLSGTTSVRVKASTGNVEVISRDADVSISSGDDVSIYPGDMLNVYGPNNIAGTVAGFYYRTGGFPRSIMRLSDTGVEINPTGYGTLDFKVETDNKENALLVSGSTDQVLILSGGAALSNNEAAAGDVAFYVSGSVGGKNHGLETHAKISVFGGDLHVSGNLTVDGGSPGGGGGGAIDVGWLGPSTGQIDTTGSLGVSGSLYVANAIQHIGDPDTKMSFTNDKITFTAGNREFVRFSESTIDKTIFNNGNGPVLFIVNNTNGEVITADANGVHINSVHSPENDFRVETDTKSHTFFVDAGSERIGIDNPSPNELLDVNGNIVSSGFVTASMGLSGSLTRLADNTSYLIAGNNVTITSASNGAVTIAAVDGGTTTSGSFNVVTSFLDPGQFVTTSSLSLAGNLGFAHPANAGRADTFFFVSGNIGDSGGLKSDSGMAVFGGDTVISGNLHLPTAQRALYFGTDVTKTYVKSPGQDALDMSGDIVRFGANISQHGAPAGDTNFFASGSINSKNTGTKGTAVFGGDLVISGSLVARQREILLSTYFQSDLSPVEEYIPLFGSIGEQASPNYITFSVRPCPGRLMSITLRSNNASGLGSTTVRMYKGVDGDATLSGVATDSVTRPSVATDTATTFTFSSVATWEAGDIIGFSIEPTNAHRNMNATIVLENDWVI